MLIIRLQTPEDQDFSYTQLGSNAISSEWVHGNWEQAVKLAGGQPVTLLIPTLDVLLTRTILVTSNSRQLRQALPYALEESLVGELEDQHFVWQTGGSDMLDVAVIDRERLKQWMAVLRQYKLRAKAILPDVFALPWSDNMPTLWQRDGQAWVRTGACSGFSCPAASIPWLLDSLFDEGNETRAAHVYSDTAAPWQDSLKAIADRHPNMLLQRSLQDGMGLNLLSGYQDDSMSTFTRHWKRWRVAAALAVLTGGIAIGIEGMETWQLSQQLAAAQQRNLQFFNEVFPAIKDVTLQDVGSRVKSEIKRMAGETKQAAGKASVLPRMSMVAKIFQQEGVLKITEIRSRESKLSIVFEAPDLQVLDRLGQGLTAALGHEVDIKSTQANNVVRGELTLEVSS